LAVAGARDERELWVSSVLDHEARVLEAAFAAQAVQVGFPTLAVGWVRKHEVELTGWEAILGEHGA